MLRSKLKGQGGGAKCPIHSAAIAYSVLSLTQSPHAARLLPTARRYRPVIDGRSIARQDRCVQVSARACTSMCQRCSVTFNHTHTHTCTIGYTIGLHPDILRRCPLPRIPVNVFKVVKRQARNYTSLTFVTNKTKGFTHISLKSRSLKRL